MQGAARGIMVQYLSNSKKSQRIAACGVPGQLALAGVAARFKNVFPGSRLKVMLEQGAFVLHAASAWLAAQPHEDVFGTGFNALFFIASFGVLEGLRARQKSALPWWQSLLTFMVWWFGRHAPLVSKQNYIIMFMPLCCRGRSKRFGASWRSHS